MTLQEANCAELCVKKHTQLNFKVMSVYVEIQPQIVQKRIEEMNKAQQGVEAQEPVSPPAEESETTQVPEKKDSAAS